MNEQLNAQQCREIIAELAQLIPAAMAKRFPQLPKLGFDDETEPCALRTRCDPVFTGGGIVSLLITDKETPQVMFTKDVDLVVEIASNPDFYAMERAFEGAGFRRPLDEFAEPFTWEWKGLRIDSMPHRQIHLMPHNRWFDELMKAAQSVEVLPGHRAWIASAPCFIATKFEAFFDRGKHDFLRSKDLGDILAVVNGRAELGGEIQQSAPEVRSFLRKSFGWLLEQGQIMESLPEIVPERQREQIVFDRMKNFSSLP